MTHTTMNRTGTLRWQAPELLFDTIGADSSDTARHNNTKASDVYAFALVCYEVNQIIFSKAYL